MARVESKVNFPKRGDVYLVRFDPTVGSEIKKTRPAIVVQNNIGNRYSSSVIVLAISSMSNEKLYPTEVLLLPQEGGIVKRSTILANQIRSVDKSRLVRRLGKVNVETVARVDQALKISLGLIKL
jgi:mRNA interferase MazF